jgi:hypothetical protein
VTLLRRKLATTCSGAELPPPLLERRVTGGAKNKLYDLLLKCGFFSSHPPETGKKPLHKTSPIHAKKRLTSAKPQEADMAVAAGVGRNLLLTLNQRDCKVPQFSPIRDINLHFQISGGGRGMCEKSSLVHFLTISLKIGDVEGVALSSAKNFATNTAFSDFRDRELETSLKVFLRLS